MKRLSVIIPGYNTRKEWWVRCVRSVAAALGPEDQVICVDDGSRETVDGAWFEVRAGGPEVKVVRHEKNLGLPSARNTGLEAAAGSQYVTFVDSDDEVREETYERCLRRLEETGADIAVYGLQSYYLDFGWTIRDNPGDVDYGALTPADVAGLVRQRMFYYMCNKVFRRSFLEAHDLWVDVEGVPCEDAIFNVSCVVHGAKWVTVGYCGYQYYRYDGSLLSSYKPTLVQGLRKCNAAWKAYKDATPGAYEALGAYDERSEQEIARAQWMNIWRRRSPYTLRQKWRWLQANYEILLALPSSAFALRLRLLSSFTKQALRMWIRAHLYVQPLRRRHQRRFLESIGAKIEKLERVE